MAIPFCILYKKDGDPSTFVNHLRVELNFTENDTELLTLVTVSGINKFIGLRSRHVVDNPSVKIIYHFVVFFVGSDLQRESEHD